jgi:hypothetical protein
MLQSLSILLALATVPVSAAENYLVEPMLCEGRIYGDTSRISPDYFQVLMKFTSFKSTRKEGGLADSLQVENAYFGPGETIIPEQADFMETWYMGPLKKSGARVYRSSLTGRGDDLELKVISTSGSAEILEGNFENPHTVAGAHGYKLKCKSKVVETPSRIDDNTSR